MAGRRLHQTLFFSIHAKRLGLDVCDPSWGCDESWVRQTSVKHLWPLFLWSWWVMGGGKHLKDVQTLWMRPGRLTDVFSSSAILDEAMQDGGTGNDVIQELVSFGVPIEAEAQLPFLAALGDVIRMATGNYVIKDGDRTQKLPPPQWGHKKHILLTLNKNTNISLKQMRRKNSNLFYWMMFYWNMNSHYNDKTISPLSYLHGNRYTWEMEWKQGPMLECNIQGKRRVLKYFFTYPRYPLWLLAYHGYRRCYGPGQLVPKPLRIVTCFVI